MNYCGNIECHKRAIGVVWNGKEYCSIICARVDSKSLGSGSELTQEGRSSTPGHGERSAESSIESDTREQKTISAEKSDTSSTTEMSENLEEQPLPPESDDFCDALRSLGSVKTSIELKTHPPDKYFEPPISSALVKSPSLNMINESITQLDSIRKDLRKDYDSRKMEPDQALMSEGCVDRIKTICMVNSQIVATMKLGLEIVKAMQEK